MLEIKLNIVNKREYEENENYKEVIIRIPKPEEELRKDFQYLELNIDNLSIQDTHINECEIIDSRDPHFSACMSTALNNIILRAKESGYTTPYQDMNKMCKFIKSLNEEQREKLLAVLEYKKEQISNMKDAIKYGINLNDFVFFIGIENPEEYAKELVIASVIDREELIDYLDLRNLGIDYMHMDNARITNFGLIYEKEEHLKINRDIEEEFE